MDRGIILTFNTLNALIIISLSFIVCSGCTQVSRLVYSHADGVNVTTHNAFGRETGHATLNVSLDEVDLHVTLHNSRTSISFVGPMIPFIPWFGSNCDSPEFRVCISVRPKDALIFFDASRVRLLIDGSELSPIGIAKTCDCAGYSNLGASLDLKAEQIVQKPTRFGLRFALAPPDPQVSFRILLYGFRTQEKRIATPMLNLSKASEWGVVFTIFS